MLESEPYNFNLTVQISYCVKVGN